MEPMQDLHTTYENSAQDTMQNLHTTYENSAHHIDIDIYSDIDVDTKPTATQCEQVVDNSKNNNTDLYSFIKETATAQGFYLTEKQAKAYQQNIDPAWLSGKYNFMVFAAGEIKNNSLYSEKTHGDRERIFAKGWSYQNFIKEYPEWLTKKIKNEADRALEELRNTPPKICPKCKKKIEGLRKCPECGGWFKFSEEEKDWVFVEGADIPYLSEAWKNVLKQGNEETAHEEIDF
jgi:hypothetical protein